MTKKTRKILFLICLFLFIIAAPIAVLYSQGYRFDFENKKLTQTGGLFIKAEPKQAEIYINEKLAKKTDLFFGSALIENLLPKRHKIQVTKEKYFTWEKTLEIREKEVTEVKNLILFPKNLNFTILSPQQKDLKVENFWFSPDRKKIILQEIDQDGWNLKFYDINTKTKSYLISQKDIKNFIKKDNSTGSEINLINLEFSNDPEKIYLDIKIDNVEKEFILKLNEESPDLIAATSSLPASPENNLANKKIDNDLYYLDISGNVFKNQEKLTEKPLSIKKDVKYHLDIFQNFIFLKEGKLLYLLNPESKLFEKLFEEIEGIKISPDNTKLVLFSGSEIWLFSLENIGKQKAGEKLFLIRLSEKINDVSWLNSDYLVFNSGNYLKTIETDNRDKIQTWDIGNFPGIQKIDFNRNEKRIYVLNQGELFISDKMQI